LCVNAGDRSEGCKNESKVADILFVGRHKKKPYMLSGQLKDALKGVNGEVGEGLGKGVSLPKTHPKLDRQAGDPVENDPRKRRCKTMRLPNLETFVVIHAS
jgi:hypothetical protein